MIKKMLLLFTAIGSAILITACGDTDKKELLRDLDPETRSYIKNVAMQDELLEGELENKTIKWLATWDINPDDTGKNVPVDLAVFQERYGGEVRYYPVAYDERYEKLAQYINSGEEIDFFSGSDMDAFPKGAIKEMFVPVDDYIDFDSELWKDVKEVNDSFEWNDKHYLTAVNINGEGCAVIYNKNTIAQLGFEDPSELLEKGEWNWNTFEKMLDAFVDNDNQKYGIDGWWFEEALVQTTGIPAISLENGKLVNNLADSSIERAENWLYKQSVNGNIAIGRKDYGWTEHPEYIGEGKLLFYPCGLWRLYMTPDKWLPVFGEDMGFVPMPKDPESDKYYIPAGMDSYLFVKNGGNPEGTAKYLDCKRYVLLNQDLRNISDNQTKKDFGWSDEMIDMKNKMTDMALENPGFDFSEGASADVGEIVDSGLKKAAYGTPWSETFESIYQPVQSLIDEINEK